MSRLPLLLLVLTAITGVLSGKAPRTQSWDVQALQRKADYAFIEGLNASLDGREDSRFALVEYAYGLNPADITVGSEYGFYKLQLGHADTAEVAEGIALMRRYFDSNPKDLYSGLRYALVSQSVGNMREALRAYGVIHNAYPDRSPVTRRYAEMLAQVGGLDSLDRAMSLYDTLEVTDGRSLELTTARMNLLFQRGDTASVLTEGRRQWSTAPASVENNVFMGEIFSTFAMNDSARIYYDRAVDIDSTSAMATYSRAMFYNHIGDSVSFDREIFRVLRLEDLDMSTKTGIMRNYVSELYTDSLQRPRVLSLFDRLVAIHPHEPELRKMYALYLISIGRAGEAAEQQDMGMSLEPDDEQGWHNLSYFFYADSNKQAGIEAIRRGLHYFPDSPELYTTLAGSFQELDSLDAAGAAFDKALALTDSADAVTRSTIMTGMADLLARQELADSAIAVYREALKLNPLNTMALNNCAYFLACRNRDLDDARAMIEYVIKEDADEPTWLDTYAWVLFKQKDYEKARETIERVLELTEVPSAEIFEHAGDILFFCGEVQNANEYWREALKLAPDNELLARKVRMKTYFYE